MSNLNFLSTHLCKACSEKLNGGGDWAIPYDLCLQCQGKREEPNFRKVAIREALELLLTSGMGAFAIEKEEFATMLMEIAQKMKGEAQLLNTKV